MKIGKEKGRGRGDHDFQGYASKQSSIILEATANRGKIQRPPQKSLQCLRTDTTGRANSRLQRRREGSILALFVKASNLWLEEQLLAGIRI
jgi:hypothetical protein